MSMLQSGVESANSTIEAMLPEDQVTFFTLFCIIAVVVIVALTFLIGMISCPQDITSHLLGLHCLSGACGRKDGGGEKGVDRCRHHSGLTLIPVTPAASVADSASSVDSGGSEEWTGGAALLSSSSTSIDTIKPLRTGDGVRAAAEHVYDVIPDQKSRSRQNGNSNSAHVKRGLPKELFSLEKDDHYQTPSPVVCRLHCCHGNTNPANKQDADKTRHSQDFLHFPKSRSAASLTHSRLDLRNCLSNVRRYHHQIIPSYGCDKYAISKQTSENNKITEKSGENMKMGCKNVNTPPDTHPRDMFDLSGQYDPVSSQTDNLDGKATHKHSTKPRTFISWSNVPTASDDISSPRLLPPREALASPRFNCRNDSLSSSLYQNCKHSIAKHDMLMQKPDVICRADWKDQEKQQLIPTFNDSNFYPSKRGFSECFCTSQTFIRVEDKAICVPRQEYNSGSKHGEPRSQKDEKSKPTRGEKYILDYEPLARYVPRETTRPCNSSEYSSQHDTSEPLLQYGSNENSTRYKSSEPTKHYVTSKESRETLSSLTRPSATDKKGHHFSGPCRQLLPGQKRQSFPGKSLRSAGVGQLTCWAAVSRAQRGHALSSCTAESSRPNPSVYHRLVSKDKPANKFQSHPVGSKDHHRGKHSFTQTQGYNLNIKLKPEHGQHQAAFSPTLTHYTCKEQPSLDPSFLSHSSNISTRSVAAPDDSAHGESVWSSHCHLTEPCRCCQETTHWTPPTHQVPEHQLVQPDSSADFFFNGILPFKDICRQNHDNRVARQELQASRENPNETNNSFGDYVIMNNPQDSMSSSEWNAASHKSVFASTGISQGGKVPSGVSNQVLPTFSVRDLTSPYQFQTPADAVQSLKSYIRRNF